jgi:hypothetical protein
VTRPGKASDAREVYRPPGQFFAVLSAVGLDLPGSAGPNEAARRSSVARFGERSYSPTPPACLRAAAAVECWAEADKVYKDRYRADLCCLAAFAAAST